jgi:hypothetical protein
LVVGWGVPPTTVTGGGGEPALSGVGVVGEGVVVGGVVVGGGGAGASVVGTGVVVAAVVVASSVIAPSLGGSALGGCALGSCVESVVTSVTGGFGTVGVTVVEVGGEVPESTLTGGVAGTATLVFLA